MFFTIQPFPDGGGPGCGGRRGPLCPTTGVTRAAETNAPAMTASAPKPADAKAAAKQAKKDKKAEAGMERKFRARSFTPFIAIAATPNGIPTDLNENQWKTIMTHMRVRANLPASQARLIMDYLEEQGGY